jgi:hypothetical protein
MQNTKEEHAASFEFEVSYFARQTCGKLAAVSPNFPLAPKSLDPPRAIGYL